MPIAFAWSRGVGNIVTIMPRITAEVIAPPTPCTNRAPTSIAWLCASPHASEASVKTARPARKIPRRETRAPRRPASSSSPPKAIRYALTTHARLDAENPRSSWIDGSATFTTVTSSTIISMPAHSTTRAIQRERSSVGFEVVMSVQTGGRTGTHRSLDELVSGGRPNVENHASLAARGDQAGVAQRRQMVRRVGRADREAAGEVGGRARGVEVGDRRRAGRAKQPRERPGRVRAGGPQRRDAARRVDERRLPGLEVDDRRRGQRESARHKNTGQALGAGAAPET